MTAENAMIVMFTAVLLGVISPPGEAGWAPTDAASLVSYSIVLLRASPFTSLSVVKGIYWLGIDRCCRGALSDLKPSLDV